MKTTTFLILIASVVLIAVACKKDDETQPIKKPQIKPYPQTGPKPVIE